MAQISLLYGAITEVCTPQTCPVMRAGPKYKCVCLYPPFPAAAVALDATGQLRDQPAGPAPPSVRPLGVTYLGWLRYLWADGVKVVKPREVRPQLLLQHAHAATSSCAFGHERSHTAAPTECLLACQKVVR